MDNISIKQKKYKLKIVGDYDPEFETCDGCDEVSVNVKYNLTFAVTLCDGCFEEHYRKCVCCDEFCFVDTSQDGVCENCYEEEVKKSL